MALEKNHLTDKGKALITIMGQRKKQAFYVPNETAKSIVILIKTYQMSEAELEPEDTLSADIFLHEIYKGRGKLGTLIQGARFKEGLTQEEFAKQLGISQANLSKYENGQRNMGKKMAMKFAEILKVDYRVFL